MSQFMNEHVANGEDAFLRHGLPHLSLTCLLARCRKLVELHILLLQSVLADERAKGWWADPSTHSSKPAEPTKAKNKGHEAVSKKSLVDMYAKPFIKCDIDAILASSEPAQSVRRRAVLSSPLECCRLLLEDEILRTNSTPPTQYVCAHQRSHPEQVRPAIN